MSIVRDNPAVTERNIARYECGCTIRGHIDTVFRNSLKSFIGRSSRVPIELRVHAARPLDNGISSDWVIEWSHKNVGACRASGLYRRIKIGYEVTRSLHAKRIRNRRLEPENRQRSYGSQHQLGHGAARSWRHGEDALFGCGSAERCYKAGDEAVEVLGRDVDVSRIVLRLHGHVGRNRSSLGDRQGGAPRREQTSSSRTQ